MELVNSFHLDMDMRIDLGAEGARIEVPITVAADFQAPDRSRGTLSISFLFFTIESQFVTIGDTNYVTDPETGEWGLGGDAVTPLLDPDAFIGRGAIAEVRGLKMLGKETLEGVSVYQLAGALTPNVIGETGASGDVMVSYWIGVEDSLVRLIEATGEIGLDAGGESLFGFPADEASLSMTLTFSDYGKPVAIEAPELSPTPAPPTPTPIPGSSLRSNPPPPAGMAQPRSDHTATLLMDGRVLVTGGLDLEFNALSSVEVYDPASGTWSASSAMFEARRDHTATLLPDGRVLIAGGHGLENEIHASAELFDPSNHTWTSAGDMSEARLRHTATLLQDDRVLLVGGPSSTAEIYDPASGTWKVTDGMALSREFHTASLLNDGSLLVTGGVDNAVSVLAAAEIYDPTGAWYATGRMTQARRGHTSTLMPDGAVLVVGGVDGLSAALESAEIYDPSDGTWSAVTSMEGARSLHTATLLGDGTVLVAGGEDANGPLASSEIFDPTSATWSATGRMTQARREHTETLLGPARVLVVGGASLVSVEAYQPAAGTWASKAETATQ